MGVCNNIGTADIRMVFEETRRGDMMLEGGDQKSDGRTNYKRAPVNLYKLKDDPNPSCMALSFVPTARKIWFVVFYQYLIPTGSVTYKFPIENLTVRPS